MEDKGESIIKKIKGAVFDMDGVIIDSEPLHFECSIKTLGEFGVEATKKDIEKYVGTADYLMWGELIAQHGIDTTVEKMRQIQNKYRDNLFTKDNIIPVEGTIELIKQLNINNIKIGLASSSPRYFIEKVLQSIGIHEYFHGIVSGQEIEKSKPEPDIYLKAASLIEVDPEFCIAIEDANTGVRAAKAAGMLTFGYQNPNSGKQDLSSADLIINHMDEVLKVLET